MKSNQFSRNRLVSKNTNQEQAMLRYKQESLSPTASWVAITIMLILGMLADSIWSAI